MPRRVHSAWRCGVGLRRPGGARNGDACCKLLCLLPLGDEGALCAVLRHTFSYFLLWVRKMMDLRRDDGCGVREACGKTHWDEGGDGSYKGW